MVRVLSGLVMAAVVLAVVWFGSTEVLLGFATLIAVLALHEYRAVLRGMRIDVIFVPTAVAVVAVLLAAMTTLPLTVVVALAFVGIATSGLMTMPGGTLERAVVAIAASAFAVIYLGLALSTLVGVHRIGGRGAVIALVATVALSDTAQYYAGRAFGKTPLAPTISPKKTREGVVGGLVAAPVLLFFVAPTLVPLANPTELALVGLMLVPVGIAGDLFESALKRAGAVKDSSTLIPGHGGVLDRIDALLFAAPVFYTYLWWLTYR